MLGERIKKLRQRTRMGQEDFAQILGVKRQTLARWENDERVPDALMVKKLCKALKVSADELLGKEVEEKETMPSMFAKEHYVFGKIKVGANGELRIPKEAREVFQINKGDEMIVLGDIERGIELLPADILWEMSLQKHSQDAIFYCKS